VRTSSANLKQTLNFHTLDTGKRVKRLSWASTFLRNEVSKVWPDGRTHWQVARDDSPLLPTDPAKSPILCYDKGQWIVGPLTPDEPARHKVLDLIGDISLLGSRIWGQLFVHYPGHKFNCQMIKYVAAHKKLGAI
jgi:hypothetical protein